MAQENKSCTMELNKTAESVLDTIKSATSIFYGKGVQSFGSGIIGYLLWFMAYLVLICGIIPAIPFVIMMAFSLAVCKWFFYKFRTL
jgi:hypothetical protein